MRERDSEFSAVGRFAPSPTGDLHLGSLFAALAGFLDARAQGGRWLLRIDDLDGPRSDPASEAQICRTLEAHGLLWDDERTYASHNLEAHEAALRRLMNAGHLFYCRCSRRMLAGTSHYPGTCRAIVQPPPEAAAIRVNTADAPLLRFHDRLQGDQQQSLQRAGGDFIVRRRDDLISYQLAVVVDDALSGINQVVRGADLLTETGKQLWLARLLEIDPPSYLHLPVINNRRDQKLSKQAHSAPVSGQAPGETLHLLLQLLQQAPPHDGARWSVQELLGWAVAHWRPAALPATTALTGFVGW
ncbi:MAG: tRNA glutamyl-Q(34) synthetase GluQRS [Pseudomonadota bacterium]